MVFQLTDKLAFPDPHYGDPDGLLAVGGDLSIDRLILAYSNGIFPWYAFREELIQWWCPMDRVQGRKPKQEKKRKKGSAKDEKRYRRT